MLRCLLQRLRQASGSARRLQEPSLPLQNVGVRNQP